MRLIRLYIAIAMLRASLCLMLAAGNIAEAEQRAIHARKMGCGKTHQSPVEHMLLGSIVGLAICTLWIWISARAGR